MRTRKIVPLALFTVLLLLSVPLSVLADEASFILPTKPLPSAALVMVPRGRNTWAQGTGLIVDRAGKLIVTNAHVAGKSDRADAIFPILEKGMVLTTRSFYLEKAPRVRGRVLARDTERDLALIELDSLPAGAEELKLAASSPNIGDRARLLGNPTNSPRVWDFASGKISTIGQRKVTYESKEQLDARLSEIATDHRLEKGVSGGPVINDAGELIAVISAVRSDGASAVLCVDVTEVRGFLALAYRNCATTCLAKSNYAAATAHCTRALRLAPEDPLTHNEHGVALSYLGRYEEAIASYTAAIKLDPKLARAYRNRGSASFHRGDYDQAVTDCSQAIQLDPKYALAYLWRGRAYAKLEKHVEAGEDYDKAVRLDPSLKGSK